MQPDNPLAALLDRKNIRVVQIHDSLWAVNLAPGNRVLFSGREAEARAYEHAERRARPIVGDTQDVTVSE